MNQKPTIPGVDPFTFAGFQWPRHLARMACGPAALRKKWEIVETLPEGWRIDNNAGSPLHGHVFIINDSPLKGGKRALLRVYPKKTVRSN